jgi:IclR family pca regulon transcriptional regulator
MLLSIDKEIKSVEVVQSLARGLAVIEAFDKDNRSLTLSDVSRRTGYSRAAARRLLLTLVELGYATLDGKLFELRPKILNLGFAYLSSLGLWEMAQPYMEELVEEVGESCSASVLEDFEVVYVVRVPTRKRVMSININIGTHLPAHATSMGRILLAGMDSNTLDKYLEEAPLERYTDKTITNPVELKKIIEQVRQDGWAMVDCELEGGLRSIAVPLKDKNNKVVAAVNISTQAQRISIPELTNDILPKLKECGDKITRALGGRE